MQSLNDKLFNAVCKGKTGNVEKLLEQGANINTRDKKDGMTPLLKACQRRNYTMQRILLSHGANAKHKDKLGLSCLHYIAESGDTESLKLLMAYQASIDSKDLNESTPLHYAADRNQINAVDTLVFCGANAFEKNKKGISPIKSSNNPKVQHILRESALTLAGIRNGDIHIESIELEPNKTYRLAKVDLIIHTPSTFQLKSLSLICRRVRPEYCHPLLKPYQKELLISDTFEFLTSETQTKAKVIMELPIYDYPDPFEDIYMKTDINPAINPNMKQHNVKRSRDEKTQGRLKWICTTEVDITNVRSFNLVSYPRKETFLVGQSQTELSSSVDKFIKISIHEKTFTHPKGKVSLEVIPTPPFRPDDITSVLSVGHFYDLTHNRQEQPQKAVNLRVPLPHDYETEGDLYLLGADIDSDYYLDANYDSTEDIKHWEVIDVNPKITKGCVNIPINHFSIYVASEGGKDKLKEKILSETSDLCRRASLRKKYVVFLVLVKPIAAKVFKVVIECTTKGKQEDRMNYWINERYLDQKPSHTGEFESIPGTKYILKLSGNAKTVSGFPTTKLEFHPKRENFQHFQVTMSDLTAFDAASVDIYEMKGQADGSEVEEEITAVGFRLTGTPFVDDNGPEDDETFPGGFTRDSLLRQLCNNMDDEWIKVAVMLGLSFRTVETYRTNSKMSSPDKKFKVMQLWRDTSKHRVDYGVDDLVSVLHRIDREDLVQIIQKELKVWLKTHSENPDRFYQWTERKLTGPTFHSSDVEQPVPCSDRFFVLLIDKFGKHENINQVGLHMGLSKPETDKIFNDALISNREHQLLCMFVAIRDKIGDMFKTFSQLISSFNVLQLTDATTWVYDTVEQWLSETEKEKNPVPWRQEIWHFLHKFDENQNDDDGKPVAKTEENEDKGDNEKENERRTPVDDEKNEVLTDQKKGKDDGNEFSGEEKQNQEERKKNRKETNVTNETDSNVSMQMSVKESEGRYQQEEKESDSTDNTGSRVSMHSSLRNEEIVKQEGNEEKIKFNDIDKTGSNVSMHSALKDGEVVKQKRTNDEKTEVNGTDKRGTNDEKTEVNGTDKRGTNDEKTEVNGTDKRGSNKSIQSLQRVDSWQKMNRNTANEGSNVSIQSLQRVDSWEKMNRNNEKREITNTANEGSNVSIQSLQRVDSWEKMNRNNEKREITNTANEGSNVSIQSLQRVDSWEKMNRNNEKREITNTANEGSNVSIQNSQNEKESKLIVVVNPQSNAHVQDVSQKQVEFASHLSHKIVDQALESATCGFLPTDTDVKRNSNGEDIKDLRELLETNMVVTTTSADPSRTSSQSQLEDDGSTKPKESDTRSDESVDLQVNSSKPVSYSDTSSQSDVDDKNNTDKKPFLDMLNQHLPSADSSDDSSTE